MDMVAGCGQKPFKAVIGIPVKGHKCADVPWVIRGYGCGEPFNSGNRYFCEDCAKRLGLIW